ncbi:MAG: metallophosphoesterase family protein, partial [Armatimonadetes bacterium]|nr:metallophosphoesterase family protein [Armatimonadota bacterium]
NGDTLRENDESLVIAWLTNRVAADFVLTWGKKGTGYSAGKVVPVRTERFTVAGEDGKGTYDYAATLTGLSLNSRYEYRVTQNGKTIVEGFFTTRKPRGQKTRFVVFGDNAFGDISDRNIAYQAFLAKPDFVVNTGDNVYENGLVGEYYRFFFPICNSDVAGARQGAPLLRSVPFYTVMANHDVNGETPGKVSCLDFDKDPDAGGYYTCMHLPGNGLAAPSHPTPLQGKDAQTDVFRKCAGERYPRMANYSFDYADAHFLCLDSNTYTDPTNPDLQAWIADDLSKTNAAWKIVVYHHPAFNVGNKHNKNQQMRVLSPLLEKHGVHFVLNGHEHVYQRTRPLRFAPTDISRASLTNTGDRRVPGDFQIDRAYDGVKTTRANGIVYITTGAGGKYLYDPEQNNAPETWTREADNHADYVVRFVSDRHSLTVFDMTKDVIVLRQIDQWGGEIDRCRFTKG